MILFFQNTLIFWIMWSVLFVLFSVYILFLVKKRRHYHSRPTEFTPPENINPLLAGYLIDGRFHIRDYIAGFIYLVQQGVIDVDKQKPKKARFDSTDIEYAHAYIENIAFDEGYIKKGLSFYQATFLYGTLFFFIAFGLIFYVQQITTGTQGFEFLNGLYIYLLSLPLSLYLAYKIIFLSKMKLTKKGLKAKNTLIGFKKFLNVAESDKLDYFNHPESEPDVFMEYLPYAIALGVDENWNYKYAGLLINPPSWYALKYIRLPILPDGMRDITDLIDVVQEYRVEK